MQNLFAYVFYFLTLASLPANAVTSNDEYFEYVLEPEVAPNYDYVDSLPEPVVDTYEYYDQRRFECGADEECPTFHYCFASIWTGNTCQTFMEEETYSWYNITSCKRSDAESGKEWPDHQSCVQNEDIYDARYSTSRCYEALGFKCQRSYLMPCTPNYDEDGNIVQGEEESCPEMFTCETRKWNNGDARVCVPVPPKELWADVCETSFDCGYDELEGGWPGCWRGICQRVLE